MSSRSFIFACLCVVVAGGDCSNPVFQNPSKWGMEPSQFPMKLTLSSEPIAYPSGAQQCKYFENDKQCCTNDTLTAIHDAFTVANVAVNAARDEINNNPWVNNTVKLIEHAVNAVCTIALCPHNFESIMSGYLEQVKTKSLDIQTAQLNCISTQLAYVEGMSCMACDADWKKYIDNATTTVSLAESVCVGVVKGCQPVHNSINSMLSTISQFISTVIGWGTFIKLNITLDNVPDMCGGTFAHPGDCSKFFCHDMLNGFELPDYGWDPSKKFTPLVANNQAVASIELIDLHHRLLAGLTQNNPAIPATTANYNKYTSGGYDALAVGCMDMPDAAACVTDNSLPAYGIVLIVLGVVSVIGGGIICIQKRTKASGDTYTPIP